MASAHRHILRAAGAPLAAAIALALPSPSEAAPVLIMGPHGHVSAGQDPFLPPGEPTPTPATASQTPATASQAPATASQAPAAASQTPAAASQAPATASQTPAAASQARVTASQASARAPAKKRKRPQKTVRSELTRLLKAGAITSAQYGSYSASFNAALSAQRRLRGTRATELQAVLANLHDIAVAGNLTPGRLPVLFQTLDYNRQWWTSAQIPAANSYVEFAGSQLVWEYYPGQGIELQVLGTFAKADGLYTAGPADYPQMRALLAQMIPLAVNRAGGRTWEYYFRFGVGKPPWTSAMSQGTGIEALTRAYLASHDASYLQLAHQALPVFMAPPPSGVRVATGLGARYVQYTFTPGTSIINAFLQSLIGLYDYAQTSGDPVAQQLFAAGNAEAQAEVLSFDTGAWSLYQPGVEDTLSYHQLVIGFLQQLCQRTQAPVYCTTAQHFTTYLTTPPTLQLLTQRLRKGKTAAVQFQLSKYSHVGIVLVGPGGHTLLLTSANFGYGKDSFKLPSLKHPGAYTIRLAATDLAGNFSHMVGTVQVT